MSKITTIPLQQETKEALKELGHKGETYDAIIAALIKLAKRYLFFERQKYILSEERFVKLEEI